MCNVCNYLVFLREIETLLSDVKDIHVGGSQFAEDVTEKASNIRAMITEHEHVSQNQRDSIEAMQHGVDRFFSDND